MHKPKFHYSPDFPDGGGGATIEKVKTEVAPSLDKWDGIDITAEPKKEEVKIEPTAEEKEKAVAEKSEKVKTLGLKDMATDEEISGAEKAGKIKALGLKDGATDEEITKADRTNKIKTLKLKDEATDEQIAEAEVKAEEERGSELKLDDDTDLKLTDGEEASWKATAKELGLEIADDKFEDFKKAFDEKIEAVRKEEQEKQYELKLDDHTPEARGLIKFLDSKGNLEDFVAPLAIYDEALLLPDEKLVEIDLRNKKWDDDKIAEHIAVLKEESKLEAAGYALRKQIEGNKAIKSQDIIKSQELQFQANETKRLAIEQKENESIKAIIDKSDEFLGGKLSKETKEALYKKHLRGDYRKRLESSPEDAVKAMLFLEFGEKQYKQLAKDKLQEGKDKVVNKLHNIKKIETGSQRSKSGATGFDIWDEAVNGTKKAD